jgi:alkylresorcinol/alkylpyrone synthase
VTVERDRLAPGERDRVTARLVGVGTALPEHVHKQADVVGDFYAHLPGWRQEWAEVFASSGIDRRATVISDLPGFYARPVGTAERMRVFTPAARQLGAQAARAALDAAGADAASVGDLLAVSCTGYEGPGLDTHLTADLNLDPGVRRLFIGHMGCYAALPALRTAAALTSASGKGTLLVCVELCTLHLQPPTSREEAVQVAIFGDGAAAALVAPGGPPDRRARGRDLGGGRATGPALIDARALTVPDSRERMRWQVADDGFRMWLSPRVPALVQRAVGPLTAGLLEPHGLQVGDVAHWVVHPGGPEILDRVQRRLGLPEDALACSWETLADGGNRSSATVLFVLERLLASGEVAPGDWIVVLAFGTGLTLEALLLRA